MTNAMTNFEAAAPELLIAIFAMLLLLLGVFRGNSATRFVTWLAVGTLIVAGIIAIPMSGGYVLAFNNLFVVDTFAVLAKLLIVIAAALALILSMPFNARAGIDQFEFPVLILLSVLGMMMMVSANDLISLYIGLELQSLALYIIAAIRRDSLRSSEAGLKYFVLGALSSGILLYGMSMIYGFAGTTSFIGLAEVFSGSDGAAATPSIGVILGIVFVAAGLAFKVSAVPFHMWTPDTRHGILRLGAENCRHGTVRAGHA